jgi:hypothetical protein
MKSKKPVKSKSTSKALPKKGMKRVVSKNPVRKVVKKAVVKKPLRKMVGAKKALPVKSRSVKKRAKPLALSARVMTAHGWRRSKMKK